MMTKQILFTENLHLGQLVASVFAFHFKPYLWSLIGHFLVVCLLRKGNESCSSLPYDSVDHLGL